MPYTSCYKGITKDNLHQRNNSIADRQHYLSEKLYPDQPQ